MLNKGAYFFTLGNKRHLALKQDNDLVRPSEAKLPGDKKTRMTPSQTPLTCFLAVASIACSIEGIRCTPTKYNMQSMRSCTYFRKDFNTVIVFSENFLENKTAKRKTKEIKLQSRNEQRKEFQRKSINQNVMLLKRVNLFTRHA